MTMRCSFAEWQRLLELFPGYLSAEQGKQLRDLGLQCCVFYDAAGWVSCVQKKLRWLAIPKIHQMDHLSCDCEVERFSPRMFHNYGGEDFMGHLKAIVFQTQGPGMAIRVLRRCMLKLQAAKPQHLGFESRNG